MTTEQENELICERLLRWTRHSIDNRGQVWTVPASRMRREARAYTPDFLSWADAGLILEALAEIHKTRFPDAAVVKVVLGWEREKYDSMPDAIRACGLGYLSQLQ